MYIGQNIFKFLENDYYFMSNSTVIGDYQILKRIGIGSTAKVKLGQHKVTGQKAAIKIMKKKRFQEQPNLGEKIRREVSLMKVFNHPNLLKLLDFFETETHIYLVLEYAAHGELLDYLLDVGVPPANLALKFFRQIIYGLDFLHTHSICHRDIKPENVLLDENDNVKIADFGFARFMKSSCSETYCGSPHYAAPEIVKGIPYDGKLADVWSCGVVLFTLLCVCFMELANGFHFLMLTHRENVHLKINLLRI